MDEKEMLLILVDRLERERSYALCIELANALGYEISGEPGEVWMDKPHESLMSIWFSQDALIEDLLADARSVIARSSSW